jgi:hypothetical protein
VDWANAYARALIETQETILQKVTAKHTGYRRLRVEHERIVSVYEDETWLIEDRLPNWGKRPHRYRLHWLLPDWAWTVETRGEGELVLQLGSPHGPLRFLVTTSARPLRVQLARAGQLIHGEGTVEPFDGWCSPTYGQKIPALSFSITVESDAHVLIATEITFPK